MKPAREEQCVKSRALQIRSESGHFALHVGQVPLSQLGNDHAASLNFNLNAVQFDSKGAQGLVGILQTLEAAGMILVVKPIGADQEMKLPQGAMQIGTFAFCGAHPRTARSANQRASHQARSIIGGGAHRCGVAWTIQLFGRPKNQPNPHYLLAFAIPPA
jgi:hypothetical protein